MSRYTETQDSPPQPTIEGDQHFLGMDMKTERALLPAGMCTELINKRLARSVAGKRAGTSSPVFANSFGGLQLYGSGVYSNPNGDEVILVAAQDRVFQLRSGISASKIDLPPGTDLSGSKVEFSQQFDKVLLLRDDPTKPTLVWDGTPTGSFVVVTKAQPLVASLTLLPNPAWAINFGNRALFPVSHDEIGASPTNDFTEYDASLHKFRVNSGRSDAIVGAYAYAQDQVLIGKRQSFDIMPAFSGDLGDAYVLSGGANGTPPPPVQVLSTEIGIVARKSGLMVGGDFFFLSDTGIYRISQVIQQRMVAGPVPVSDPIQPLIERINWAAAAGAIGAVHSYYVYFAVPIDGSAVNNALLVYNTVTQNWESLDVWNSAAAVQIDNLFVAEFYGQRQLYAVNHAAGQVYLLNSGKVDEIGMGTFYQIADRFVSRGYATLGWNASTRRAFQRFAVALGTWGNSSVTINEVTERTGDRRVKTLTPIAPDRRKYRIFGKPNFGLNNSDGTFLFPGREDYSVRAGDGILLHDGVPLEEKQRVVIPFAVQTRAGYVSYEIESAAGDCDVMGILVESQGTQKDENRRAA